MRGTSSFVLEWQLSVAAIGWLRAFLLWGAFFGRQIIGRILEILGLKKAWKLEIECPLQKEKEHFRVMFVPSDNAACSGAFISMVTLIRFLREKHKIDAFIVLPGEGSGAELVNQASIPCCIVPSRHWTIPIGFDLSNWKNAQAVMGGMTLNHFAIRSLREIIRKYSVDLVHVNTTWTYVGAVAAIAEEVPFIWHLREFLEEDQGRTMWSRPIGNAIIAKANATIAISDSIRAKYSSCVSSEKLVVIMNGIDDSLFPKSQKQILGKKPYTFIMVGNFQLHKGHLEFTKACTELYRSGFRDFRIWFIGAGDDEVRAECAKVLEKAGLAEIATFMGFQKHPELFLWQADVAFMCSRSEAFGRVTVEAMMSGCLVIGAETAATAELIQNGKTGLLYHYRQDDISAIVYNMKKAISAPKRMREIAAAGRDYALKHFTAKRNAEEIAELHRSIVHSSSNLQMGR